MRDRMGSRQGETGVPLPTVALRYTLTPQGQRLSLSQTAHGARSHGAPGLRRYDAARQPRSRVLYGIRSIAGRVHSRRGPALGGLYLRKATDFSQMRCVYRCRRSSPSTACRWWCVPSAALSPRAHTWSDAKRLKPRARRGTQVLTVCHSVCKRTPSQEEIE